MLVTTEHDWMWVINYDATSLFVLNNRKAPFSLLDTTKCNWMLKLKSECSKIIGCQCAWKLSMYHTVYVNFKFFIERKVICKALHINVWIPDLQISKSDLHSTDGSGQNEALVICVLKAPCSGSSQVIPESWPAHPLPGPVHQIHQEVLLWEPTAPICKGGARAKGVWGELCGRRPVHTQKESWRSLRWVVWSQGSSRTV